MTNFIKTNEKVEVKNYPYGFKLRTTLYDSIEFNTKKGYRHITQTINPKTGKPNAEKKSTYALLKVRFYDENGHIKTASFSFNGGKELNEGIAFLSKNFELFEPKEVKYLYKEILMMMQVHFKASVIYGGVDIEQLKPFFTDKIELIIKNIKADENI